MATININAGGMWKYTWGEVQTTCDCSVGCRGTCTACFGQCQSACTGTCTAGCSGSCVGNCNDGCKGCDSSCGNLCARTCYGECHGGCYSSADGCGAYCTSCATRCQGTCGSNCHKCCVSNSYWRTDNSPGSVPVDYKNGEKSDSKGSPTGVINDTFNSIHIKNGNAMTIPKQIKIRVGNTWTTITK